MSDIASLKEIRLALDPKIFLNFFNDDATFIFGRRCPPFIGRKLLELLLDWFFYIFLDIKHIIRFIQIYEDKIILKIGSEYTLQGGSKKDLDLTLTITQTPGKIGATQLTAEGDGLDDLFDTIISIRGKPPIPR